jgi:hypothetical protein
MNGRQTQCKRAFVHAAWADFASELAFEAYAELGAAGAAASAAGAKAEYCRVLYNGRVLALPPCAGRADGVCRVSALRAWLEGEGLLLDNVQVWNTLCKPE